MKITITDKKKISGLQEEFNALFPYLKIEIFTKPHKPGNPSPKKLLENNNKTLGECRTIHNKGRLEIIPQMTVTDLEQKFNELFGLSVQVFRRSGNAWLETSVTDSWTLEHQNNLGKALTTYVIEKNDRKINE